MATLSDELVGKFQPTTHFRNFTPNNDKRVNSMAISQDGSTLIASSNHHVIDVFDCNRGIQKNCIPMHKYGCGVIDFADDGAENVVVGSMKQSNTIRLLNIEKKTYGTYFVGHTSRVTSLSVHSPSHLFLSGGMDMAIQLWDTRSASCISKAKFDGIPLCAWAPNGALFAVGVNSQHIHLFDVRGLGNGPFVTFDLNKDTNCDWSSLKFSHDGKQFLISSNGTKIRVIDSVYGKIIHPFLSEYILR